MTQAALVLPDSDSSHLRDKVFDSPQSQIAPFSFNEKVAAVFDDMISRSVPQYLHVQDLTIRIARRLVQPNTSVVDLGCSTATTLLGLVGSLSTPEVSFIGVDNSAPMLERARQKVEVHHSEAKVTLLEQEIENTKISDASLVLLHYTLQFLAPEQRLAVLRTVHSGLVPGGALLLTEKMTHPDAFMDELLVDLYYEFKEANGYSKLEISQKREALENVLIPYSLEKNLELLKEAGFECNEVVMKAMNFGSILAIKK